MKLLELTCDRCGERPAPNRLDYDGWMPVDYWCDSCLNENQDQEPNYDAITASERHARAWDEHLAMHTRK